MVDRLRFPFRSQQHKHGDSNSQLVKHAADCTQRSRSTGRSSTSFQRTATHRIGTGYAHALLVKRVYPRSARFDIYAQQVFYFLVSRPTWNCHLLHEAAAEMPSCQDQHAHDARTHANNARGMQEERNFSRMRKSLCRGRHRSLLRLVPCKKVGCRTSSCYPWKISPIPRAAYIEWRSEGLLNTLRGGYVGVGFLSCLLLPYFFAQSPPWCGSVCWTMPWFPSATLRSVATGRSLSDQPPKSSSSSWLWWWSTVRVWV